MAKAFASQGDMAEKKISFTEIGKGLYAFTAEGDPNSGVIIGDDSVMVVEAQATPRLAQKVIDCIRGVTDKPISHVVLTHYHAVRVLGASAFNAPQIIMTTHSPYLLSQFQPEEVTLMRRQPDGSAKAVPLRDAKHIKERMGDDFYLGELWYNLDEEELLK